MVRRRLAISFVAATASLPGARVPLSADTRWPVRESQAGPDVLGYARLVLDGSQDPDLAGPADQLIVAIDRAAQAGWAETARLAVLIAVTAGAVAGVILACR